MRELLLSLVQAQRLDERLATLRRRARSLPEELTEREAAHAALEAEAEALENERRSSLARARELENEARSHEQRIERLEEQARNLRDAGAVEVAQHEAEELRDRVATLENEALALLERAEELAAERDRSQEKVEASAQELALFRRTVASDEESLQAEILDLERRREEVLGPATGRLRDLYEKLLPSRKGRALAPLRGDSCGGCGMVVPPNDRIGVRRALEVVQCRSCARILVHPDLWSEAAEGAAEGETAPGA